MLILVLAANTAFADFPRLASIVARDRYMPRQFMNLGDKLAFSNGIVALSRGGGDPDHDLRRRSARADPALHDRRVPVVHAVADRHVPAGAAAARARLAGQRRRSAASAPSSPVIVLVIVAVTKGLDGAWIVLVLIPLLTDAVPADAGALRQRRARSCRWPAWSVDTTPHGHIVIVPIGGVQRAVLEALRYASSLAKDVRAVYVNVNPESLDALKRDWPQWGSHVKLVVLQSPYRSMTEPLLDYIDRMEREHPDDYVTVVLPEFVVKHWWHHLLHNQSALTLKAALLFRRRVVTTSVPFHLNK